MTLQDALDRLGIDYADEKIEKNVERALAAAEPVHARLLLRLLARRRVGRIGDFLALRPAEVSVAAWPRTPQALRVR
jgi:branched-subunit amino acid aminotransferase/4-amino-4-deoxychorismate lyase